jgi:AcrR family transcriptional regulator
MSAPAVQIDRRERIREVATDLFAAHGFNAVGMRTIADAAGIQTSTIYHYFPSKENLLHSIALDSTAAFIADSEQTLASGDPPAERVARLIRAHIHYFTEHRKEEAVGLRELRELTTEHREEVRAALHRYQARFRDLIEEGIRDGEFSVTDAEVAAVAILSMFNAINSWLRPDGRLTPATVADLHVTMILALLRHPVA